MSAKENTFIKNLLEMVRNRWKMGTGQELRDYKRDKIIRTSVYGDITIDKDDLPFVDTFYLQRLRNISQTGILHYVYPDARHSRFEHSLGVYWMTKKILSNNDWDSVENYKKDLRLAALLHDIGHGPFSHMAEIILNWFEVDNILRKKEGALISSAYHERKAASMVLGHDYQRPYLFRKEMKYKSKSFDYHSKLKQAIENHGASPERIAKFIQGDSSEWLAPLINGPIDMDKLDYFQRDAHYTGTPGGGMDTEFLLRNILPGDNKILMTEKGVNEYLQLLLGREFIYSATVYHPVATVAQSMFLVALDDIMAQQGLTTNEYLEFILHLDMMDDQDLRMFLEFYSESRKSIYQNIWGALSARVLYGRLMTFSFFKLKEILTLVNSSLIREEDSIKQLGQIYLKYLRKDQLQAFRCFSKLNKYDVLIFAVSPYKPESILKYSKSFDNMFVKCHNDIVPLDRHLQEMIENDRPNTAIPNALYMIKKKTLSGMLIGPKSLNENPAFTRKLTEQSFLTELMRTFIEKGNPKH